MVRESQRLAPVGSVVGGDTRLRRVEQLDMASNRVIQVRRSDDETPVGVLLFVVCTL